MSRVKWYASRITGRKVNARHTATNRVNQDQDSNNLYSGGFNRNTTTIELLISVKTIERVVDSVRGMRSAIVTSDSEMNDCDQFVDTDLVLGDVDS